MARGFLAGLQGREAFAESLKEMLASAQMHLCAQKVVSLRDGATLYHELLLRLPSDTNGVAQLPEPVIRAAERHGLVSEVDRWVLSRLLLGLRQRPDTSGCYAINLSGQSLSDAGFRAHLEHSVDAAGVDPRRLCFEITETAPVLNLGEVGACLRRLAERGCRFALDDFGAGFASFAYLKALPLHFLKIDGSIVRGIRNDARDRTVVSALMQIGHAFALTIIAEHVQDTGLLTPLRELGIDAAQGYALDEPRLFF